MKVETQIERRESSKNAFLWIFKKSLSFLDFFKSLPSKSIIKLRKALLILFFLFIGVSSPDMAQIIEDESEYSLSVKERSYIKLVAEVSNYVYQIAPKTEINPKYLVDKCLEYEMDIIFVIAQGILESHLGTKGIAVGTNSTWNVGTYDNGKILYRYDDPNKSIEPYLQLLKERYLVGKDLHHLVEDRGFKDTNGKRFASARGYENALRKLIVKIDMETEIALYQSVLKLSDTEILVYFGPVRESTTIYYSYLRM